MRNVRLMFPLKVEFELTKKCNLSCNHCMIKNIEVESSHKEELSTDEIKKTIDYLNKKNIIEIQFTGGEPFFRKDLPDIAKYVDKKKIKVLISSNGTIISEEVAKKLSSCNFLSVEISIDGDEKNHDNIRGNGSYNKAIRGIEILRRYRIPVMIETVVNKNNFVNIPFIYTLSKKLGAYRYVVHNLRLLGNAIENKDNLLPTIDQLIGVQNYLIQKSKNNGIQIKPPIHPLNNYLKNIPKEKLRNYFGCGAATYKCGIKANGDIVPCLLFKQGVGNIKTNSIEKIWNGIYFSLLRDMISLRKKVCNDCSAESYCDSGCPLVSFIYYRNFIEKDQSCPVIYSERYLWKKKII